MSDTTNLIEPCTGWKCGDGLYPILEDAQMAAMTQLLRDGGCSDHSENAAVVIVQRRNQVLSILSLEAPKERKPRADRGKPRTKKIALVAPTQEPPAAESTVTGSGKYRGK